jgi:hypothetical protein
MMVQSWPHHLRHQWSQISTFVFLNHIRHHTYFKSSYVHIRVFHILHHHTMKLLLAFKSFLPRRLIVEIGSENWFDAGCPIRQRKLFRCRQPIRQRMLTCSKQLSFGSESQFRCTTHNSAANANSLQKTQFWQRITNSLQTTQFRQRMLIRCRRLSFDREC